MPTLSLAMIVKNEGETLGRCLASVAGCFDQVVVVDTGSTDCTRDIAASFRAEVYDFEWIDDFAAARDFAFSKATADFVMWLDADDVIKPADAAALKTLKSGLGSKADVYYMKYDYAQDADGNSTCLFSRERIVRNTGEAKWSGPVHERLIYPGLWRKEYTDVTVTHRRDSKAGTKDPGRNLRILRKVVERQPRNTRMRFYFARELLTAGLAQDAVSAFEGYLREDDWHENRVNAHLGLAQAYLKCGHQEKAIEICLKGIELDARWAEFSVMIGQVYYDRKDWSKATFWFETAARCKPPDTMGFVNLENYTWAPHDKLCVCYWESGERLKAYEANEKALSYKPKDARLLKNREVMKGILFPERKDDSSRPKVDIIIPTYNNLDYLKVCIGSVRRQTTDWPYSLTVVDSGNDATAEWLRAQCDIMVVESKVRLNYAEAVNLGIQATRGKYVLLLNNDTVVASRWLSSMMAEAMKPEVGAVGPLSNCDRGWAHNETVAVNGKALEMTGTLEELRPLIPEIEKISHAKVVTERFWIVFYAALIPREVIENVGALDESFHNGLEDFDYCKRIRKAGYKVFNTYDSFVYHFYMKTPRPAPLPEVDLHNKEVVALKYDKPLFVMHTGKAWERWNGKSADEGGLGGSETGAIYIARAFAGDGYRSVIFGDCEGKEGTVDGVEYVDSSRFDRFVGSTHMDIFVSSRRPEIFDRPIRADYRACLATDTAFHEKDARVDRVDRFFAISPWHSDLLASEYKIPAEKLAVSRLGVDLARFVCDLPRQKGKIVYTSAPDRGLEVLLDLFPRIRQEFPEASLHVFYGFQYLEATAAKRNDKNLLALAESIKKKAQQPGVLMRGRLGQKDLANELLTASLFAYPTFFHETFCISAAEAMAAGVPVVTSKLAALQSTVGDAGVLIEGNARSKEYQERFIAECILMLRDEARWKNYSAKGREKAKRYSWSTIAGEWLEIINKDIAAKRWNPCTRSKHGN